jgi:hypothetical protein
VTGESTSRITGNTAGVRVGAQPIQESPAVVGARSALPLHRRRRPGGVEPPARSNRIDEDPRSQMVRAIPCGNFWSVLTASSNVGTRAAYACASTISRGERELVYAVRRGFIKPASLRPALGATTPCYIG